MRTIGNILWFIFGGLLGGLAWMYATISAHITNILTSGELDETSVGFSDKCSGGRKPKIYNLDMILSVGNRVNSKRGIAFRKWANW